MPCVRLRPIALAIALTCFLLFIIGPLVVAVALLVLARWDVSIPVALGAGAFVALSGYSMSSSIQWVELDGWVIRGRRLFTRKIFELRVADIVDAHALNTNCLGPTENAILDFMLQTSNRGFVLLFRDGSRLPLIRADMSGLDQFLGMLAAQMKAIRNREGENVPSESDG
jgi:hypothetical protein